MSLSIAVLAGLLIGSFLNVVIYRLPRGQSVVRPRSNCPNCGRFVSWYDNIPLLSFLLLKGRCRSCGKSISWRYPIVELVTAILSLLVALKFPDPLSYGLFFFLFAAPLIAVFFIDLEHMIIPDLISLPGIPAGILVSLIHRGFEWGVLADTLIGILVGGGVLYLVGFTYEKLRKKEGLGFGDVKLTAMLGAFFGWQGVVFILLISSFLGSVIGLLLLLLSRKGLQSPIPYGPFLAAAAMIFLLYGERLISLYLSLTTQLY